MKIIPILSTVGIAGIIYRRNMKRRKENDLYYEVVSAWKKSQIFKPPVHGDAKQIFHYVIADYINKRISNRPCRHKLTHRKNNRCEITFGSDWDDKCDKYFLSVEYNVVDITFDIIISRKSNSTYLEELNGKWKGYLNGFNFHHPSDNSSVVFILSNGLKLFIPFGIEPSILRKKTIDVYSRVFVLWSAEVKHQLEGIMVKNIIDIILLYSVDLVVERWKD